MPFVKNQTLRPTRGTIGAGVTHGKKGLISYALTTFDLGVPATTTDVAILPATPVSGTSATVIPVNYVLPVPRSVRLVATGTAASVSATPIVVTGKNIEGKTFTETFTPTAGALLTATGLKVFHTVTSISVPTQAGAGVSYSLGLGDRYGINTRNLSVTQTRLVKKVVATGVETLVSPAFTAYSTTVVEDNVITLDTPANGNNQYTLYAFNYNWQLNPVNDNPDYGF